MTANFTVDGGTAASAGVTSGCERAHTSGAPEVTKQAVCLHEEDNAVLWKHVDPVAGTQARRMHRMVVSVHATVANYEYLIYWRLGVLPGWDNSPEMNFLARHT